MGNVYLSPNIKKETVRIDPSGNIIDPNTKKVIAPNVPDYVPTPQEQAFVAPIVTQSTSPLSIQEEIEQAEKRVEELKEKKKQMVEEMKRQLELLEQ